MMDALRGTDMLGTDIRAIKFHVTPVDPLFIGDLLESLSRQIPGVSDQTEGPIQAHGPDIFRIPVHHRTGGDTGAAGNAFRVQADGLPFLRGRFDPGGFRRRRLRNEVGFQGLHPVDKKFEIYGQVLDDGQVTQRLK